MLDLKSIKPGDYIVDANENLYRLTSICHEPSLFLEDMKTGEKKSGAKRLGGVS